MEVRIQAIHFDASEKLQDFIQKKTAKLEKYCDDINKVEVSFCLLYTSPSPRDTERSRMPSSA